MGCPTKELRLVGACSSTVPASFPPHHGLRSVAIYYQWLATWNTGSHPFVWAVTGDIFFDKVRLVKN